MSEIAALGKRVVSFDDWRRLDRIEVERGQQSGSSRRKILRADEMLALL